jgi:hypothetical protein
MLSIPWFFGTQFQRRCSMSSGSVQLFEWNMINKMVSVMERRANTQNKRLFKSGYLLIALLCVTTPYICPHKVDTWILQICRGSNNDMTTSTSLEALPAFTSRISFFSTSRDCSSKMETWEISYTAYSCKVRARGIKSVSLGNASEKHQISPTQTNFTTSAPSLTNIGDSQQKSGLRDDRNLFWRDFFSPWGGG